MVTKRRHHFATYIWGTALVACAGAPDAQASLPSPEQEIRAARVAQNAAIAARNADSVAAFWTEDVSVTAGLGFVLRGRAAYKGAFGHDAPMLYTRTPESIRASATWPLAWEEGTWTGTATVGQPQQSMTGRYSAQWVKEDDRWRIRAELFVALECTGAACSFPVRLR
jgi:ketosteroid isomerase-like protein